MQQTEEQLKGKKAEAWEQLWLSEKLLIELTENSTPNGSHFKKINDLLLIGFISYMGCPNIDNSKIEYLQSCGVNNEDNEQRQLLLILARILLKDGHISCACIRYCRQKGKIQITFPSLYEGNFDDEGLQAIRNLVSIEQLARIEGKHFQTSHQFKMMCRKLFAMAIVKEKPSISSKKAAKIKRMLAGKSAEEKKELETFTQLENDINEFSKQWEKELENPSSENKKEVDFAMENFFVSYWNYCKIMQRMVKEARGELERKKREEPENNHSSALISPILLEPLVHVHDINCLLLAIERDSDAYLELAPVIIDNKNVEVVLTNKRQHAEMKMLEANNFEVNTFTTESWPAVITRSPCLYCWMTLQVFATNNEEQRIITERFGLNGTSYLNWRSPSFPPEQEQRIVDNYWKFAKEIHSNLKNLDEKKGLLDLTSSSFASNLPINNQSPVEVLLLQQALHYQDFLQQFCGQKEDQWILHWSEFLNI